MARPRKNNADYFSHDNNMRNHRKIKALRNTFGMEGYGVFNMFLETQTECDKCKIKLSNNIEWEILAADFSVECQSLKDIMEYCIKIGLIEKEGDYYFSENLIERLSPILELREKKREWANKRWDNDTETELKTPKTELKTSESMQTKLNQTKLKNIEFCNSEELLYEPLIGNKTKGAFLDRARAKKGKPPMLKKDPSTWAIINLYRRQYRYVLGKDPYVGNPDYFHVLSITKKMSPQDMEKMVVWYVKAENKKFIDHPNLKSIFTIENLNKFNNQK